MTPPLAEWERLSAGTDNRRAMTTIRTPGPTLGVVGGGQLGRMLAEAAAPLGVEVVVLDPTPDCPAAPVARDQIVADFDDEAGIRELAARADVLTFEIELADQEALGRVHEETGVPTWFIHDAVEGGLGFSKRIYGQVETIAERTRERVSICDCKGTGGFPACIMDSQCGDQNRYLHTEATVKILDRVLAEF